MEESSSVLYTKMKQQHFPASFFTERKSPFSSTGAAGERALLKNSDIWELPDACWAHLKTQLDSTDLAPWKICPSKPNTSLPWTLHSSNFAGGWIWSICFAIEFRSRTVSAFCISICCDAYWEFKWREIQRIMWETMCYFQESENRQEQSLQVLHAYSYVTDPKYKIITEKTRKWC